MLRLRSSKEQKNRPDSAHWPPAGGASLEIALVRPQLVPGTRVRVIQQIPHIDRVWTTVVEGTIVSFRQAQTGAWFAHAKGHKFWLDRLEVRTDDGEIIDCILDAYSRVEVVERPDERPS